MPNNPWSTPEAEIVSTHILESDAAIANRLKAAGYDRQPGAVEAYRKMVLGVRRPCAVSTWTDERTEKLKALWKDGLSASLIARALGGVTRNAVIGKVHRLGLGDGSQRLHRGRETERVRRRVASKARDADRAPKPPRNKQKPAAPFIVSGWRETGPVAPTIIPQLGAEIESPRAKPWIERRFGRECAFPVGEASGADQWSCCNPTGGQTYCQAHATLAYNGEGTARSAQRAGRRRAEETVATHRKNLGAPLPVDEAIDPDRQRGKFTRGRFGYLGEDAA